jgi:SAM-dependent methyltransferase
MDQHKIWEYFQNDDEVGDFVFGGHPRYEYIASQIEPGKDVLNIGVGRGGLEALLVEKACTVSCLDPSEDSIVRLRDRYGFGERAQVGVSQAMPFLNAKFDYVVMSEVLEHLADDILTMTLSEVRRVLKKEGYLIGTVPANESLVGNLAVCPNCGEKFHRWGHVQSFSPHSLRQLLVKTGFEAQRVETRAFPDWQRKGAKNCVKSIIRYVLGRAGAPIAMPNIYFIARRGGASASESH